MKNLLTRPTCNGLILIIIIQVCLFCSIVKAAEFSQWQIKEGWAYRNGKKFFAVGIGGLPGYDFIVGKNDTSKSNIKQFLRIKAVFNLIYVQTDREQEYMQNALIFTGASHFRWRFLAGYKGNERFKPDKNGNGELDLPEMQFIRDNLYNYFNDYIKKYIVEDLHNRFKGFDFIWMPPDEPNTGGRGWIWYPSILNAYKDLIKSIDSASLVYADLFGTIQGDRHAYELYYTEKFGQPLRKLPEGIRSERLEGDPANLNSYVYSYDGTPRFFFDTEAKRWKQKKIEQFKDKYYNNVFQASKSYKGSADVMGVNCYIDFRFYPEAAGIVVDAIKDACGKDKPVWLFFDGGPYKKDLMMSNEDYIKLVKCQVYTSIAHGASGVLFWSKKEAPESYWTLVEALATQLKGNSHIFKAEVELAKVEGDIHYTIRKEKQGNKYLLAVNTNKEQPRSLTLYSMPLQFKALEVKILEL